MQCFVSLSAQLGCRTKKNDRYNRQLEPEEKALAKELADKSGGQYTQARIEDQQRQLDMTKGGQTYIGSPDTLIGDQQPSDAGARWTFAGQTADGKPILTQATVANDLELQRYIVNAVNGSDVPSTISYAAAPAPAQPKTGPQGYVIKPAAGNYCATAECAAGLAPAGIIFYPPRDQIADTASSVSTAAGRFSAATAAAAAIPSPYTPGFAAASLAATVIGMTTDAVSQMAKPDIGQYWIASSAGIGANAASEKYPFLSPAINETSNKLTNTDFAKNIQGAINSYWNGTVSSMSGNKNEEN